MADQPPTTIQLEPGDEFDVFISHAGEDKDEVARPLTRALEERDLRVWLDEQELTLGDSLARKIDDGLARSRFGVVILSPHFFEKPWPQMELDGLVARESNDGAKVILPVWHEVDVTQVTAASPTLAGRLSVNTAAGLEAVAEQIYRAIGDGAEPGQTGGGTAAPAVPALAPVAEVEDPGAIYDQVLDLLRADDAIGLDQTLRQERAVFERGCDAVTADHINHHFDEEVVRNAGNRLTRLAARRLASLVPLALYKPGGVRGELRAHSRWMSRTELRGGGMTWQQPWRFPWWVVGMSLGGLMCQMEQFEPVGEIVSAQWQDRYDTNAAFVDHPGEVGHAVAQLLGPQPPAGQQWEFAPWVWLAAELRSWTWLLERHGGWLEAEGEPEDSFAHFDFIDGLAEGFRSGDQVAAFWSLRRDAATALARRLRSDDSVRTEVAAAVGVDLERFDRDAPEMLASAQAVGRFSRVREVAGALAGDAITGR